MREYKVGEKLEHDEYLFKTSKANYWDGVKPGFLSKPNKNGDIPKAMLNWGSGPVLVYKEELKEGWKFYGFRLGESRSWAVLVHPDGFTLEIYINEFTQLLKTITMVDGKMEGEFRWVYSKLLKE